MDTTHCSHESATTDMFRRDPSLAADYLVDVLSDGDEIDIELALRSLNAAFGTGTNSSDISVKAFQSILQAMGLRLAVHPINDSTQK